jgi:hypothetical protein
LDGPLGQLNAWIRASSLPVRAILLLGAMCVAGAVAALYTHLKTGDASQLHALAIACGVCTASSMIALVLSLAWHGTPSGVAGTLGGMLVGLGIPLVTAMLVQRKDGDFGFYGWIVGFYLVSLTIKTLLVAPGYAPLDPSGPLDPYAPADSFGRRGPNEPGAPRKYGEPNSPAKKSGE